MGLVLFDGIERIWEGGTRSSTGTGGAFRNIRQGKCREDASCRWKKGVQGLPNLLSHAIYSLILSVLIGLRIRGVC